MKTKKIMPFLDLSQGAEKIIAYERQGADGVCLYTTDFDQEEVLIKTLKSVLEAEDVPMSVAFPFKRLEDVKKILYAGAAKVIMSLTSDADLPLITEAIGRFTAEKVTVGLDGDTLNEDQLVNLAKAALEIGADTAFVIGESLKINNALALTHKTGLSIIMAGNKASSEDIVEIFGLDPVIGIATTELFETGTMTPARLKHQLKDKGVPVIIFESAIPFSEFKLNSDGLIPVIVQDYKTEKVLMLAYMNEASYEKTLKTGCMTYFSRSRQELWLKGETSGHFQYVKSLDIDCDKDTILAKVAQVGAACHTGSESCFFTSLVKKDYDDRNPATVLNSVMDTILDRKTNPKEGSYTNYLFDKGIDKILKKVGEEATEIVIAAKNPDSDEVKYEIADFLYHMMVLMAERDVTWKEITKELADRH